MDPAAVFVPHPIQDRTDDELYALANDAADAVLAALATAGHSLFSPSWREEARRRGAWTPPLKLEEEAGNADDDDPRGRRPNGCDE